MVGWSYTSSGNYNAFLYSNGQMTSLGTLPGGLWSWASGINASGQVVGGSYAGSVYEHAFLYSNGAMADLNNMIDSSSGWTLEYANAINDSGQVVGYGINASGNTDAFLLTLVSTLYWKGTGTWDTGATANWSDTSGGPYDQTWTPGMVAVFQGSAGTVTVASAGVSSVKSITFSTDGYTLGGVAPLCSPALAAILPLVQAPTPSTVRLPAASA